MNHENNEKYERFRSSGRWLRDKYFIRFPPEGGGDYDIIEKKGRIGGKEKKGGEKGRKHEKGEKRGKISLFCFPV